MSATARRLGCRARPASGFGGLGLRVRGYSDPKAPEIFAALPGVERVELDDEPLDWRPCTRGESGGNAGFGTHPLVRGGLTLIAGLRAVGEEERLRKLARALEECGADALRAVAYPPGGNPHGFQGLGEEALHALARVGVECGLPVVAEAEDERSLELVEHHVDVIQIGARNMHNYPLLKRAGRSPKPVLLQRGPAASLEEFLLAAEYLLSGGNPRIALCASGIRTFSTHSRLTLDLAIVPRLREICPFPLLVDPSHACGGPDGVAPLARAAVAVGADGVILEVHSAPPSDGAQAIELAEFAALAAVLRSMRDLLSPQAEAVR